MNRYLDWAKCTFTVVDIETLAVNTVKGSVILSIGYATLKNGHVIASGEIMLDRFAPEVSHFVSDEETMKWHTEKVPTEAFAINFRRHDLVVSNEVGISQFCNYIDNLNKTEEMHFLVGNSPDFDFGMISRYCEHFKIKAPWKYFQLIDYRSIASMLGVSKETRERAARFAKTFTQQYPHNALYDAVYEAAIFASFVDRTNNLKAEEAKNKPEADTNSCLKC